MKSTLAHRVRSLAALFLTLSIAVVPGTAQRVQRVGSRISPENRAVLNRITADSLRGHLSFIASDLLEGRDSPSRGLDIASEYIAAQFRRAGLEPIGDDGYFQTANIRMTVPNPAGFKLVVSRNEADIEVGPDQVTMARDALLDIPRAKLFKVDSNDPASVASLTPDQVGGQVIITERSRQGWRDVLEKLSALKPALILLVSRQLSRSDGMATRRLIDPARKGADRFLPSPFAPFMYVSNQNLLTFFDQTRSGPTGATVSLHAPAAVEKPVRLRNVIGLLRGSDPALKDTYVFLTAHYDHLGVDRGGGILNGANDNGSGTVTVIELASAIAARKPRPKRSIVFATFFGEEKELVGSDYYAKNLLLPAERTVAVINLEQLGRTDSDDGPKIASATLTGFGFTDLTQILVAAGKLTGVSLYNDDRVSAIYFTQSDNLPFAEMGIPAQTLTGLYQFPDYHGVGDTIGKIDFDNMVKLDRMVALGLLTIADSPNAPRWNEADPNTKPYVEAWKSRRPK